jgi:hypothetical protein
VSLDLFLGKTSRDWSCGGALVDSTQPWSGQPPAPVLAGLVRAEVSRSAGLAVKLRRAGRLPDADWRSLGQFHRRWVDFCDRHPRERFGEADVLALWNFREANKKLADKLRVLAALASPARVAETKEMVPVRPDAKPWYALLGATLALVGAGLLTMKGRSHVRHP